MAVCVVLQAPLSSDAPEAETEQRSSERPDNNSYDEGEHCVVYLSPHHPPSVFHILNKTFFVCVLEMVEAVVAVEEREVAECQSPGGEAEDGAAASSAASPSSDAPREPSSTSSPDTDSPVMINEDVSK